MRTNLKRLFLVGALMTPLIGLAAEGDPAATKVTDTIITAKVKAEFAKDKLVSATNVKVETNDNGVVQLTGSAKSKAEAEQAIKLAQNVKGVTAVKSDIVIAE